MMWAITATPNIYFFETITDVEVLKAPKKETLEFVQKQPGLLFAMAKRIFNGLEGTIKVTQALLGGNARAKVALIMLTLTKRFGKKKKNGEIIIQFPLTHRLVASLAGLTRETTSLELAILQSKKIIEVNKHTFTVKNLKELELESSISFE